MAAQVDTVIDLLTPLLDADIPTFAVLGNHDHEVGAVEELTLALEQRGVVVLRNGSAGLTPADDADETLHIVGIGPARPGLSDPEAALDDVPDGAPRVVLMHNPASFPQLPADTAPLAVAGHTHCGQIALPGTPTWSYLALREQERVAIDGFAEPAYGAAGNRLFTTCGLGFSIVPMRVGAPPQRVVFELLPTS